MSISPPAPDRCRIVLIVQAARLAATGNAAPATMADLAGSGDLASIIFVPGELGEAEFQSALEPVVEPVQKEGVAVIIEKYSRVAGRLGADGIQLPGDVPTIADAVARYSPRIMVGAANIRTRHGALSVGEQQPDYVMFGRPGRDIRPDPHPRNLELAEWWAAMVEIPCIVLGGDAIDGVAQVARTGAEFVALDNAVFVRDGDGIDFGEAIRRLQQANGILDEHAPRFSTEDV